MAKNTDVDEDRVDLGGEETDWTSGDGLDLSGTEEVSRIIVDPGTYSGKITEVAVDRDAKGQQFWLFRFQLYSDDGDELGRISRRLYWTPKAAPFSLETLAHLLGLPAASLRRKLSDEEVWSICDALQDSHSMVRVRVKTVQNDYMDGQPHSEVAGFSPASKDVSPAVLASAGGTSKPKPEEGKAKSLF